jgi:hypothetical protein
LNIDVLFVDTKADLNAYYDAGSGAATTGVGCCAWPAEPAKTSGETCSADPSAEAAQAKTGCCAPSSTQAVGASGDAGMPPLNSSILPEKPKFNPNEYVGMSAKCVQEV